MGHRASYAIRSDGKVELFYAHWGALTVPQDVFWGPQHTEAFIRLQGATDEWLDDVFGEGGVALDKDTRTMAWFGGESLAYPPMRDAFVPLLEAVWARSCWKVRAVEDMPDIAEHVGLDRGVAEAEPVLPTDEDLEDAIRVELEEGSPLGSLVLVTLHEGGRIRDVVWPGWDPARHLLHGPAILARLDGLPTLDSAREREGVASRLAGALSIDVPRKLVTAYTPRANGRTRRAVRERWPSWEIEHHDGKLERHFAASGRTVPDFLVEAFAEPAPAPLGAALDEHLDAITALLAQDRPDDGAAFLRQLIAEKRAQGEAVEVSPAALEPVQRRPLAEPDRMRILSTAVADVMAALRSRR